MENFPKNGSQGETAAKKIVVSPSIIWWTLAIVLGAWFLYTIREVIVLFFVAVVLSAAMDPVVRRMMQRGIPRAASVGIVYVVLLGILAGILSYMVPAVIAQAQNLVHNFPLYADRFGVSEENFRETIRGIINIPEVDAISAGGGLSLAVQGIFSTTVGVFQGVISAIAVFAIAFYMSIVDDGFSRFFRSITPRRYEAYVVSRMGAVYDKIGYWMLGQMLLMVVVFLLYLLVLSLLGIPNALLLALFGGFLEIIPYIGPTVAAVPAAALGFLIISPIVGFLVIAAYILIQQAENHILVPQIMRRVIGLNPIVVILALLIGAKVAGVLGIILSVPVAAAIDVFMKDALEWKRDLRDEK